MRKRNPCAEKRVSTRERTVERRAGACSCKHAFCPHVPVKADSLRSRGTRRPPAERLSTNLRLSSSVNGCQSSLYYLDAESTLCNQGSVDCLSASDTDALCHLLHKQDDSINRSFDPLLPWLDPSLMQQPLNTSSHLPHHILLRPHSLQMRLPPSRHRTPGP